MDAQRFGKVLGVGTRAAAKALLQAADAAAAPNPQPVSRPVIRSTERPAESRKPTPAASPQAGRRPDPVALKRGAMAFGTAMLAPAARAGSVLWLEVTGVFFGLFALAAGVELWQLRGALHATGEPRRHAFSALAILLAFGWFTISNFVKAHRRAQR